MSVVVDRSLRLDVETHIMAMIHDGRLRPDDRIPEVEIARSLGISRTPVREAIIRLTAAGLVTHVPRRGAFLARLGADEVADVCAARCHLEGYAAALAAERMDDELLATLRGIVRDMADAAASQDWPRGVQLNVRFHDTVVGACGNRTMHRLWASVNPFVWLLTPLTQPGGDPRMADIADRHQALVDALASGNAERAERAFKEHILQASQTATPDARTARSDASDADRGGSS